MNEVSSQRDLLALTADIVSSHFGNNTVAPAAVSGVIESVYAALSQLGVSAEPKTEPLVPAVSIRSSIKPDYIVCLEDGRKLKILKRHLMSTYGLTPDQYRAKWGLAGDYPMVAPNYAEQRRTFAKAIGLGRKPAPAPAPVAKAAGKPRGRPRKSEATTPAPRPSEETDHAA